MKTGKINYQGLGLEINGYLSDVYNGISGNAVFAGEVSVRNNGEWTHESGEFAAISVINGMTINFEDYL